jgi:hypothetical protein
MKYVVFNAKTFDVDLGAGAARTRFETLGSGVPAMERRFQRKMFPKASRRKGPALRSLKDTPAIADARTAPAARAGAISGGGGINAPRPRPCELLGLIARAQPAG